MENNYRSGFYTVYLEDKDGNLNTYITKGENKRDAIKRAMSEYANRSDNIGRDYIAIEARIEEDHEFKVTLDKPEASLF